MFLLIAFAFLAGFITILSPCILSIAPILLAAGTGQNYYKPLGIITGLIISFSFFTLSLSAIIQTTGISPDIFRYIALCIIIIFGLTLIIPTFEQAFARLTTYIARLGNTIQEQATQIKTDFMSGLLIGIALGLIWTPCAGPILATITTIAATGGITFTTILITLAYSIGAAIPMLLICFGGSKIINSTTALAPYTHTIRQIFGVIIIVSAIAILFHVDVIIQEHIAHLFPTITLEDNALLHKELNMLHNNNNQELVEKKAPELVGISAWLNSKPLTLTELKGKVVLIDFWTYTCINCIRTLPHIQQWYNEYHNKGLEIIGVHTPEFAFEKNRSHVEDAIKRFNITYPVALDNEYQTWRAYNNQYWPAYYLINQNGIIVKTHFGEGNYTEMENAIRLLLNLSSLSQQNEVVSQKPITPETYLGFERGKSDHVNLLGNWKVNADCIKSEDDNSELVLNFIANHVYLVMKSDKPQLINVFLDSKPLPKEYYTRDMNAKGQILVSEPRMYEILNLKQDYGQHTLILQCPKDIIAYVFTFGSEAAL